MDKFGGHEANLRSNLPARCRTSAFHGDAATCRNVNASRVSRARRAKRFRKRWPDSNVRAADEVTGRRIARRGLTVRARVNLKMAETCDSAVVSSAITGAASTHPYPALSESGIQGDEDPSGRPGMYASPLKQHRACSSLQAILFKCEYRARPCNKWHGALLHAGQVCSATSRCPVLFCETLEIRSRLHASLWDHVSSWCTYGTCFGKTCSREPYASYRVDTICVNNAP
jgi:hypothetical protein